ncbi:hypothetical protein [Hymenobacter weizhouensis]|uniref:hypothetical protein n=1 Tax=Hymenobacter sp. YIM 151500-1 TaxID=2987689 RepID=UPI0022269A57|nr:hypothetical protein [Hymenobacter sp. YIM 151500-1]UYZ62680.1 hypothetical protein OIS53_16970 [Hymenobacter sp. YIM 151500-1]
MALIAFRSEYQLSTDSERNRIFYKPYAPIQTAQELPHFLADWEQTLSAVQPDFTVLVDLSEYEQPNSLLFDQTVQVQRILVSAGVRLVAEVHLPAANRLDSEQAVEQSNMPVRYFTDLWEADQFLNTLDEPADEPTLEADTTAFMFTESSPQEAA